MAQDEKNPETELRIYDMNQNDVAAYFGIDSRTFLRWWKKGLVPISRIKIEQTVRYSSSEVINFQKKLTNQSQ